MFRQTRVLAAIARRYNEAVYDATRLDAEGLPSTLLPSTRMPGTEAVTPVATGGPITRAAPTSGNTAPASKSSPVLMIVSIVVGVAVVGAAVVLAILLRKGRHSGGHDLAPYANDNKDYLHREFAPPASRAKAAESYNMARLDLGEPGPGAEPEPEPAVPFLSREMAEVQLFQMGTKNGTYIVRHTKTSADHGGFVITSIFNGVHRFALLPRGRCLQTLGLLLRRCFFKAALFRTKEGSHVVAVSRGCKTHTAHTSTVDMFLARPRLSTCVSAPTCKLAHGLPTQLTQPSVRTLPCWPHRQVRTRYAADCQRRADVWHHATGA